MFALWLTIVCTILCYILIVIYKDLKYRFWITRYLHKLPGPPTSNYLLGSVSPMITASPEKRFSIVREWSLKYYPVYKVWATPVMASANIASPEDAELILSNAKHLEKSRIYKPLESWLGFGLFTSGGEKWFARRKLLTPTFHFNILRQFVEIFNNSTDVLIDGFQKECHKDYVEIDPIINQFTLSTITATAMGTNIDFNKKNIQEYKNAIVELMKINIEKVMKPWLSFKFINFFTLTYTKEKLILKILHTFTRTLIEKRRKTFDKTKITIPKHEDNEVYAPQKRLAMLDLLFTMQKENGTINDNDICEEVDLMVFAGHDTTAVSLTFTLMLLACYPDIQNKILVEMEEILGDIKKKPSFNELQELKFLERCIKESLRLYPSVGLISRKLGVDVKTSNGYKLLKGSIVNLHIYDLHHNPNIWPNPEKFDPDRFLPENCQNRHPYAFVPFSAGLRNCIGQKYAFSLLKSAIYAILANFRLEPVHTPESIILTLHIVLQTKDNVRVKFIPRK